MVRADSKFEYWFKVNSELNPLKMALLALTKIPFRKRLDVNQVGLPDSESYRVFQK